MGRGLSTSRPDGSRYTDLHYHHRHRIAVGDAAVGVAELKRIDLPVAVVPQAPVAMPEVVDHPRRQGLKGGRCPLRMGLAKGSPANGVTMAPAAVQCAMGLERGWRLSSQPIGVAVPLMQVAEQMRNMVVQRG
jgi:hypothetical protein